MPKFFTGLCTLLLIVVFTPATTRADPVVITGGFIFVSGMHGPLYSLVGNNFAVIGGAGDHGATGPGLCAPCVAGAVIPLNSSYVGLSLGMGSAIVDGSFYPDVIFRGVFDLAGDPIVIPDSTSRLTLTAPFSFSGVIVGCPRGDPNCPAPLFTTQLTGTGLATVNLSVIFDFQGRPLFEFEDVTYAFNQNIPEPASILLLVTGLAALGVKKLKRKR
jgi:hypothetical protein